jgi:hypothetical protein
MARAPPGSQDTAHGTQAASDALLQRARLQLQAAWRLLNKQHVAGSKHL